MKENNTILIMVALLIISLMLNLWQWLKPDVVVEKVRTETINDTIISWKYSTDTVFADKIKYKNKIVYDTIVQNNTVYLKDSAVVHRDSTENYTIDISAVKLDWYKLDITHKDTVTYVQTVNTVTYKPRSNKPQIGVFGGLGYDIKGKTFGPEIGIGVILPLTKW